MNKNIEDIIKEALDNHDAGYVTGAWEKMSARLDGTPPTPFYKKWWMAAAFGTVLVGSAVYFLSSENKDTATDKKATPIATVDAQSSDNSITQPEKKNTPASPNADNSSTTGMSGNTSTAPASDKIAHLGFDNSGSGNTSASGKTGAGDVQPRGDGNQLSQKTNSNPTITDITDAYKKVAVPTEICANEELIIGNPNSAKFITVTDVNGRTIDLAPGKKVTLKPRSQGTITVQSGEHKDLISVHENTSKLYIDVDPSILYENGIPSLKFRVPGMKDDLSWNSNIKGTEQKGDTYIVHPYIEKNVEVTVTSTNEYGCTVSETQVIDVKEYNLLAPSGFRPNSGDIQTNTFMPYALTQRNANFELVVLDPRTGAIIFSSSDATQGWDGIDKRTGEMVKENSVWAWKVTIKNPNLGEPAEYKGTITRM